MGRYAKFSTVKNKLNIPTNGDTQYYSFPNELPVQANAEQYAKFIENNYLKATTNLAGAPQIATSNHSFGFGDTYNQTISCGLDPNTDDIIVLVQKAITPQTPSPGNVIYGFSMLYRIDYDAQTISNVTQSGNWLGTGTDPNFIGDIFSPQREPVYNYSGNAVVSIDFLDGPSTGSGSINNYTVTLSSNTVTSSTSTYTSVNSGLDGIKDFIAGPLHTPDSTNNKTYTFVGTEKYGSNTGSMGVYTFTNAEYNEASPIGTANGRKLFFEHPNGKIYAVPGEGNSKNSIADPANIDYNEKMFVEFDPVTNTNTEITITGHELQPGEGSNRDDILYSMFEQGAVGADQYFYVCKDFSRITVYDLANREFVRTYRADTTDLPLSVTGGNTVTAYLGPDTGFLGADGHLHWFIRGNQSITDGEQNMVLSIDTNPESVTYQEAYLQLADDWTLSTPINAQFICDTNNNFYCADIGTTQVTLSKFTATGRGPGLTRINGPYRPQGNGF